MARRTPPLQTKGRYSVISPFVVEAAVIYTCIALRKFEDILEEGEDIFAEYYEPVGLTTGDYTSDAAEGAAIVTLVGSDGTYIHIPDTYIASFPAMSDFAYQHVVLSISLGAIPNYLDLSNVKTKLATVTTEVIGVTPVVLENIAPSRGVISPSEHEALEVARTAAITDNTTERSNYLATLQRNIELQTQVEVLTQILIDNDLISEL